MRISQNGNSLTASHITGPTHNFLGFSIVAPGDQGNEGPIFVYDDPAESWPFPAVKEAVIGGIKAAGGSGAACIRSIRVLGSDTPRVDVYQWLAFRMTQHLNEQQAAVPLQRAAG